MRPVTSKEVLFTGSEEKTFNINLDVPAFMRGNDDSSDTRARTGLAACEDARALIRLIQCPQCSRPFRTPVTLPCGHSLCRQCLPQSHQRANISYPATPARRRGVLCPIPECGKEHAMAECNVDVTLAKVMESLTAEVEQLRLTEGTSPIVMQEIVRNDDTVISEKGKNWGNRATKVAYGGRIMATYTLAESGELGISTDLAYPSLSKTSDDHQKLDEAVLDRLRETMHKELDCQVCYNLMLDPVSTSCGHTFCRVCLMRVLDHTSQCPVCRRTLPIPPSLITQASNQCLVAMLNSLYPELVASRAAAVAQEEQGALDELTTPLFVCTLSFPAMPTFLRIFEPRYKLMVRRVLEGNRQFGMMMYNRTRAPQADFGVTDFTEYGTMLEIVNAQILPSGESLLETRGVGRFRVKAYAMLDGYLVGRTERVEDVSIADEERLEAEETSIAQATFAAHELASHGTHNNRQVNSEVQQMQLNRLSTRELLINGVEFIERMRASSEPWLRQGILDAYSEPPDDPALFPYWFATVLPIAEEEKYVLLRTTSVRQRLKIVVGWIWRVEGQRSACTVL